MLYNLAQVSRLAGKQQAALDFYEEFLDSKPKGEAAGFARTYVRILERSLARTKWRDDDDDDDDDDAVLGDSDSKSPTSRDPGKGMRYGGIGLASAGLISLAVGVKFGLDAQSTSSCLSNYPENCGDRVFPSASGRSVALGLTGSF
ncbi:MAG: hypothetical protein GY811_05745 [Myxococcales bacterium]|nr:hypothetical protein [Myxococcales bacterium]